MKYGIALKSAKTAASLGLLVAFGVRANMIHTYTSIPGTEFKIESAWHAGAGPVVENSLRSAGTFGKAVEEWNHTSRYKYHGSYLSGAFCPPNLSAPSWMSGSGDGAS